MKISFTGTRVGMTPDQFKAVADLVNTHRPSEVHHGDCVGADDEFATICGSSPFACDVVAHPGSGFARGQENKYRAYNKHNTRTLPLKPYLDRNRDIVQALGEGDMLLVAPRAKGHPISGGTGFTYEYGVKLGKRIGIVWPDGSVDYQTAQVGGVNERDPVS